MKPQGMTIGERTSENLPLRLSKMLNAMKLLRECGDYDTAIAGAVGEVYAEDMLGMKKADRGENGIDGWINGKAVQVKTKEIDETWLTKSISTRYVGIRQGKEIGVEDLVVIMVHEKHCWVHYFGPLANIEGKLRNNNIIRYGLHKMQGEGLARHHEHLKKIFPDHVKSKKLLRSEKGSIKKSSSTKACTFEPGTTVNKNRLAIQQKLIGLNITLRIQYRGSDEVFVIKHDTLVELVGRVIPTTMQTDTWVNKGWYSWKKNYGKNAVCVD